MARIYHSLKGLLFPNYSTQWKNRVTFLAGAVATIAGAITICLMIAEPPSTSRPAWAFSALILWTVFPPAWFWFEYFCIWKSENYINGTDSSNALDRFKYGQEVSRNIWLAFVALLAGFYFK